VTGEAQNTSRTTAMLPGTINPENSPTTYYFLYIDKAGYEDSSEKTPTL
jgi:hypothetical protein